MCKKYGEFSIGSRQYSMNFTQSIFSGNSRLLTRIRWNLLHQISPKSAERYANYGYQFVFQPSAYHYCVHAQVLTSVVLVQQLLCVEVRKKSINRLIAGIRPQTDRQTDSIWSSHKKYLFLLCTKRLQQGTGSYLPVSV